MSIRAALQKMLKGFLYIEEKENTIMTANKSINLTRRVYTQKRTQRESNIINIVNNQITKMNEQIFQTTEESQQDSVRMSIPFNNSECKWPIKLTDWIKKQDSMICSVQKMIDFKTRQ